MFTTGELIIRLIIDGLVIGSFYALVALGYTMVYGIIKLLNFAHGDIYMVGAFVCYYAYSIVAKVLPGWPGIVIAIFIAMIFSGALGYLAQRFAYRPLLGAPRLSMLITAIGLSLIISNTVMVITKTQTMYFDSGLDLSAGVQYGSIRITYVQIIMLAVSAVLMTGLSLFIGRTMTGRAMRAIAQDKDACRLMGVNVNKIIAITFIIGSALAAIAGGLYCVRFGTLQFYMGYRIGIKAFTAAVLGGIGSIPGAMLGGLLLGLLESFGAYSLSSEWQDVFAFGLLILILILRPNGLLGKSEIERM